MRIPFHRVASITCPALAALAGCQSSTGAAVEIGLTSSGQALTVVDAGPVPELLLDIARVDVHVAGFDVDTPEKDDDQRDPLAGGGAAGGPRG